MNHRNFYGRVKGKSLKPSQQRYLAEDLPKLAISGVDRVQNPDRHLLDLDGEIARRPLQGFQGFQGRTAAERATQRAARSAE